jgi:hypothetical protein
MGVAYFIGLTVTPKILDQLRCTTAVYDILSFFY